MKSILIFIVLMGLLWHHTVKAQDGDDGGDGDSSGSSAVSNSPEYSDKNLGVLGVLINIVVNILTGVMKTVSMLLDEICDLVKDTYLLMILKPVCDMVIGQGSVIKRIIAELDKIPQKVAKPEDVDTGSYWGNLINQGLDIAGK